MSAIASAIPISPGWGPVGSRLPGQGGPTNRSIENPQAWQKWVQLQRRLQSAPHDEMREDGPLGKTGDKVKTAVILTPQTLWRGLKGDLDFNFADTMLVSKVPYYLGGAGLILGPWLGGDKKMATRMGAAVLLYLLGKAGTDVYLNTLYKARFGVDLTTKYQDKSGHIQDMLISHDFPRFDLLTPAAYNKLAQAMGIPNDVADRDGAVNDRLRFLIAHSRAMKIIMGNGLAALGAGYIARMDDWEHVFKGLQSIVQIWKDTGPIGSKFGASLTSLSSVTKHLILEKCGWPMIIGAGALLAASAYVMNLRLPPMQFTAYPNRPLEEYDRTHPGNLFQQFTDPNLEGNVAPPNRPLAFEGRPRS